MTFDSRRWNGTAPRHNIICNSFFWNFQADISALREYLQAGILVLQEFVMVGEAGFRPYGVRGLRYATT